MPRIYAPNEAHTADLGVDFINGVAALASGTSTTPWTAAGYAADTSKNELSPFDKRTPAEIRELAAHLSLTIDQGEDPDSKQTLVRAIETSLSAKYLATVTVASAAGNVAAAAIEVTITSALLDGGAKAVDVSVPVTANTTTLVATAIRAALAADSDVAAAFTVGGAGANVILTAKAAAANDGTLSIAISDAGSSTITMGASGNTTGGTAPVAQVETVAVTAGASQAGTLTVTVASALLGAGGAAVNVPITGDDDQAAEVAAKIRTALAADADVAEHFTISGADANVIVTAKVAAADDNTLAITLTDADSSGVTFGASGNTTAGVAGVAQVETAAVTATAATTHAAIAITGAGTYRYILATDAATPLYKDNVSAWTSIATGGQIPIAQVGKTITVARVDSGGLVIGLGNTVVAI